MCHFSRIAEEVQKENVDPFDALIEMKSLEREFKKAMAVVKGAALEQSQHYGKQFTHAGFYFERRDGRAIYNFDHIPAIQNVKNELRFLQEQSKAALRNQVVDEDGVIIAPPKVSYADDVLIVRR